MFYRVTSGQDWSKSAFESGKEILSRLSSLRKGDAFPRANRIWPIDEPFDWSCISPTQEPSFSNRLLHSESAVVALLLFHGCNQEAKEIARFGLQVAPDDVRTMNNLAWAVAVARSSSPNEIREAVALAKRCVQFEPTLGEAWNTLGWALYRHGSLDEADAAFSKSMEARSGGDAYDWFPMAIIRKLQGRDGEAYRYYERAMGSYDRAPFRDDPLTLLREEAGRVFNSGPVRISLDSPPILPVCGAGA